MTLIFDHTYCNRRGLGSMIQDFMGRGALPVREYVVSIEGGDTRWSLVVKSPNQVSKV